MLFKTILKKVVTYIDTHPIDQGALILKMEAAQMEKPVEELILMLDVRAIGYLRKMVPMAFPRNMRKGELIASVNSLGAWKVEPAFVEAKETVDG